MSNFIHGPEVRHSPIDLNTVATFSIRISNTDNYEHYISFYTKYTKNIESWYFKFKDETLIRETFQNIINEVNSKNINDTVKL